MFQDAVEAFNKLDKKSLVMITVIAGVGVYLLIVSQRAVVQRSMRDVMKGYIEHIPNDLCISNVKVAHTVFPPNYRVDVDYVPCKSSIS